MIEKISKRQGFIKKSDIMGLLNDYYKGHVDKIKFIKIKDVLDKHTDQINFANFPGIENITLAIVPDNIWKKQGKGWFNPSESVAKENLILIQESYFNSSDDIAWLVHELTHCGVYSEDYDKRSQEKAFDIEGPTYPNNMVEKATFTKQFQFLKNKGKSKQDILNSLKEYYDEDQLLFFHKLLDEIYRGNIESLSFRNYSLTKDAADQAKLTADSLYKIIKFLFYRIKPKNKKRFLNKVQYKLLQMPPGELSEKKTSPTSVVNQSIGIARNLLNGLNPIFVGRVLDELNDLLAKDRGLAVLSKRDYQPISKRAMDVVIEPLDPAVQKAFQKAKNKDNSLFENVKKIVVHSGGGAGELGHVEMGPNKDPHEIHLYKDRITFAVKQQHRDVTDPKALEDAIEMALIETIVHEAVHIGKTRKETDPFASESEAESKSRSFVQSMSAKDKEQNLIEPTPNDMPVTNVLDVTNRGQYQTYNDLINNVNPYCSFSGPLAVGYHLIHDFIKMGYINEADELKKIIDELHDEEMQKFFAESNGAVGVPNISSISGPLSSSEPIFSDKEPH